MAAAVKITCSILVKEFSPSVGAMLPKGSALMVTSYLNLKSASDLQLYIPASSALIVIFFNASAFKKAPLDFKIAISTSGRLQARVSRHTRLVDFFEDDVLFLFLRGLNQFSLSVYYKYRKQICRLLDKGLQSSHLKALEKSVWLH